MKRIPLGGFPLVEKPAELGPGYPVTAKYLTKRYWERDLPLAFSRTSNTVIWKKWRRSLRSSIRKHLCLDAWGKPPTPEFSVLEETVHGNYMRRKIAYESVPGNWVVAYLLVPAGLEGPMPAVICPHGHVDGASLGVVNPERSLGKAYGHVLAERGCVVLAPENAGMGERDVQELMNADKSQRGCALLYRRLSHMGLDITGLRVFELQVALNLLTALDVVDAGRIGCAGLSGGCWLSQVLTALDDRIGAVILSGYFTTFAQTIWNNHCICHLTHGLGQVCEMPDISALIAPRPQFVESGKQDRLYPVEPAYSMVKEAYSLLGAEERLQLDQYDGGHMFHGAVSIPWMIEQLSSREKSGRGFAGSAIGHD